MESVSGGDALHRPRRLDRVGPLGQRTACQNVAGLQPLPHQGFDFTPKMGIALALHVIGHEGAIKPRDVVALDRDLMVVEAIIPENLGFGAVCRPYE